MKMIVTIFFVAAVIVALIFQSAALSRKASFTGSIMLSLSLGALLWINHASYLVVSICFFMLLADISVYFFSRSVAIFPPKEEAPSRLTKLYRSAVLFFLACWTLGLDSIIWNTNIENSPANGADNALVGLHTILWQDGFLYVAVCATLVLVCSFGIFFMAKKES